jgi:hypothetical protein
MITRHCTQCGEDKTIRGVWYLQRQAAGSAAFLCEGCFSHAPALSARLALPDPARP